MAQEASGEKEDFVDVFQEKDVATVGQHLANIDRVKFGEIYEEILGPVEIGYSKEKRPDGTTRVRVKVTKK